MNPTRDHALRVAVVEDQPLYRAMLARALESRGDLRVVAGAGTVAEALAVIAPGTADAVILDIDLPDGNGIALGVQLRRRQPHLGILLLSAHDAMDLLLERRPNLDAVFVASDSMALGALVALRRSGRRVPEDVAVGGFDDSSAALAARPALTTIRQPWQRISGEMVRLLLASINGAEPTAVILPTELIRRESA